MEQKKKVRLPVIMKWVEGRDEWHMINMANGKILQEFLDCVNIGRAFPGLDKAYANRYIISIEPMSSIEKSVESEELNESNDGRQYSDD
jgi:hypothetical protein